MLIERAAAATIARRPARVSDSRWPSSLSAICFCISVESTLEQKKKYENVPVLRNLVPSQVLLGNSSFNTGESISAGLPNYVRNRIKAIAGILDRG